MASIRIAIDARLFAGSNTGDSVYWNGLVTGLGRLNLDAELLLFANNPPPERVPLPPNSRWITLPAKSSRIWSLIVFPLAARKMGASVLHTQYSLSPLAKGGITTIHDVSFFIGPEWFLPKDRFLLRRTIPASARAAKAIFAVSETTRREINQFIRGVDRKIVVTPNALPIGFRPEPRALAKAEVAQEFGLDGPYLLTVGTRWPRKNMQLAVDAVLSLPETMPHKLVVTGKPGWGDEKNDARIVRTGYVSDDMMPKLYAASDLYLAPSRHEGFGIPLLESWASQCPVLCSSGGALPEVAGDAAEVESSWDPDHWSATIKRLLGDSGKLSELRANGTARLRQFDWTTTAQIAWDTYRRIAHD